MGFVPSVAVTGRADSTDGVPGVPDDVLLARFAGGDPQAAQELTRRLGPRAFGTAMRLTGNRAEAEDIAQEAMLRLWKMAPDWQPGAAQVSTWLYRVVVNLCVDLKRRAKGRAVPLDEVPDPIDKARSVTELMQDRVRADALQEALDALPERQRQAVVLRHLQGLANPEIAIVMDVSVEAVESLTARGKRALAKSLAGRREDLGYENG